jgi:hypothetical protein
MLESKYTCNIPVVLIFYNRPDVTFETFQAIRAVRPKTLFLISDGPKNNIIGDVDKVLKCLEIINLVDWDCTVIKSISDFNLGCLRRVVTGLDFVFSLVDEAIILEDDCVPSINFFKFLEYGLVHFKDNKRVGMISGSNLIANQYSLDALNGFSIYINIWGWGTWKDRWNKHNPYISIYNMNKTLSEYLKEYKLTILQKIFWKELLTFSIYLGSTWDFQLQYTFFKFNLVTVYPSYNLVNNIGFGKDGTHTKILEPCFVKLNKFSENSDLFTKFPMKTILVNYERDNLLAKTIWDQNLFTVFKLFLRNKFKIYNKFI